MKTALKIISLGIFLLSHPVSAEPLSIHDICDDATGAKKATCNYAIGQNEMLRGNYEKAISLFKSVMELDPTNIPRVTLHMAIMRLMGWGYELTDENNKTAFDMLKKVEKIAQDDFVIGATYSSLAAVYVLGIGVETSAEQAVNYTVKATDKGQNPLALIKAFKKAHNY